jgi:hypothetical protein
MGDVQTVRAGANLLWSGFYDSWVTNVDTGFRDGLHAFYLYGLFRPFGEREPQFIRAGTELWKADIIRDFCIHGGGPTFGAEFHLPHQGELLIGRRYRFRLPFISPPDRIVIDDRVAWSRSEASVVDGIIEAAFDWVADRGHAAVLLIVDAADGCMTIPSPHRASPSVVLCDGFQATPLAIGKPFTMPEQVRYFAAPQIFRQWLSWNSRLTDWPEAIPAVAWPTDDIGIIIDINGIGQNSFDDQLGNIQTMLRCHEFGKVGINGIFYWPMGGWPPQYTGFWPHVPIPGDITPREMDAFISTNGIKHVVLEWCQFGEWHGADHRDFPDPATGYYPVPRFFEGIDRGNIIQGRYSDVQVHLWVAEFRLPGGLNDERVRVGSPDPDDWKLWSRHDGSLLTYDLWNKWEKLLDANAAWQERTRACLKDPRRTSFIIQNSSPFSAAASLRGGVDIVDTKTIHRQNVQAVVAGGRGISGAGSKKLLFEIDSYISNAYNSFGPEEVEQLYRLFFAAGADFIYAQADLFGIDAGGAVVPNEIGERALRAIRWIRMHPRRGRQIVPFALLQGDGVHFNFGPQSLQTRAGHHQELQPRPEQADFGMISTFVPEIGDWWRCHYQHAFAGLPYGPFDIATATHLEQSLRDRRFVIMCGWHGMTGEHLAVLERYMASGGCLMCAIGHLRRREAGDFDINARAICQDPTTLFGVSMAADGKPCVVDAEVMLRDGAGKPLMSRKGAAYLVWRENLLTNGQDMENAAIKGMADTLAERHRVVEFIPSDPHLEAVLSTRDSLLFVTVFNHGAIKQPCGLGSSTGWQGNVVVDARLAGDIIDRPCCLRIEDDMTTQAHEIRVTEGRIAIQATVGSCAEFVVSSGPISHDVVFGVNRPVNEETVCG